MNTARLLVPIFTLQDFLYLLLDFLLAGFHDNDPAVLTLHFDMRANVKTELAEPFVLQHHSRRSLIPVPALPDHLQVPCRFYFVCHKFSPFCRSRLKIK